MIHPITYLPRLVMLLLLRWLLSANLCQVGLKFLYVLVLECNLRVVIFSWFSRE